jgi:hypothetical protein
MGENNMVVEWEHVPAVGHVIRMREPGEWTRYLVDRIEWTLPDNGRPDEVNGPIVYLIEVP